ncbi:allantoinase PuuE [Acidiferrimicrobium sp. IK]|uniref:allantoinase PuuE n=1 Tax=Acidiferrimicrobium sp. IK TaxID=2871700 RepID=UPI0021CB2A4B|nr:allantoinase PuuE [Acidiferrimicrobium sp. IK]MCU4184503.1 allantoinase PuuE [Acidiferrimicrobium sp. IK]
MPETPGRDFVGYGPRPPDPAWPGGASIAVQFVLNYEEGGERSVLDGDATSETFLSEMVGAEAFADRHMSMESLYEYGSRAGCWRVLRLFARKGLPLTVFGVARALERNPAFVEAVMAAGHEIVGHGYRWLSYQQVDEATEAAHLAQAVEVLSRLTGAPPLGWYTGRDSPATRRLVVDHGGFLYDSDSYADDLPYWARVSGRDHLVVPYTLDTNDMRLATAGGFSSGIDFEAHLRDAFDVLWREGEEGQAKMLTVGLHARLVGRPGRLAALERFIDHVRAHDRVWVCQRVEIARHWAGRFPPPGAGTRGAP